MADTLLHQLSRNELPAPIGAVWDRLNALTGEPTFVGVFAQAPELLSFIMGDFYERIFFGGRVAMKYKQLARLKLSTVHGCRTCNLQNVPGSLESGITQAQVDAIDTWQDGPFDAAEKAVLEFAEQMVLTNMYGELTQPMYRALANHFSDAEICELGTCMAVIAGMAKLSFVLNLVEKETSCPFGPRA